MNSLPTLSGLFLVCAGTSLYASSKFVVRLERVGALLSLSEATLGLLAALGADLPEITSSVTALINGQRGVASGVVLGSNLFNLASLLGLGAIAAGWIGLHRRVVVLAGIPSVVVVLLTLALVSRIIAPVLVVGVLVGVLVPYTAVLESPAILRRLFRSPSRFVDWVARAIEEEEMELEEVVLPARGSAVDGLYSVGFLIVVVAASAAMERIGSSIGSREHWSTFLIGGVLLAIVTSLPNAVAGIYLARKGRGAAALSTAMHSNILNIVIGLAVPALFVGLGAGSSGAIVWWYLAVTVLTLVLAYRKSGLGRGSGALILVAYALFLFTMLRS